jgi:Tfp pilus assembly protein PilF
MNTRFAVIAAAFLSVMPAAPSAAMDAHSDRVALVIGNAKYPDSETPLKDSINDVRDIADELKHDGFDVETGENLTGSAMRAALDRLYGRIKPGCVALIFFSGYGIQSARQSYLIPVDAQIWTEADVRRDGISLETILGEINNRGAGIKIALLDASRRNPFERRFRSFSAGLAPVIAPSGTLVMYSAALSSVISDTDRDHSLFVSELLKEIRVPNLTAEETLNRTRVGVTRASRSEQVPWISSSLADDFSFIPSQPPKVAVAPTPKPVAAPPAPVSPAAAPAVPAAANAKPRQPVATAPRPAATAAATPSTDDTKIALALADDPTIKSLNERLRTRPSDANALYRRGQVYASKGAYALAIRDFDATLRLNPTDAEAYNNRCWTRTVVGDLQPAMRDCNEALRLRPHFVDALDSRGLLNLKSGANKNAIADFDAALKINPRLTSSLYGRGLARQRSGATAEGSLDIANAKAMDPNIVKEFADYGVH